MVLIPRSSIKVADGHHHCICYSHPYCHFSLLSWTRATVTIIVIFFTTVINRSLRVWRLASRSHPRDGLDPTWNQPSLDADWRAFRWFGCSMMCWTHDGLRVAKLLVKGMTLDCFLIPKTLVFLATVMEDSEMRRSPALSNFLCLGQQQRTLGTAEVYFGIFMIILQILNRNQKFH